MPTPEELQSAADHVGRALSQRYPGIILAVYGDEKNGRFVINAYPASSGDIKKRLAGQIKKNHARIFAQGRIVSEEE